MLNGTQRLMRRLEADGSRLLSWFPSVLRHLLHARIVGPLPVASEYSYFTSTTDPLGTPSDLDNETDSVLHVLVMLEVLDWGAEVLLDNEVQARTMSRSLSESTRKRVLQGELIRIIVSSEDLRDMLEQELRDLRVYQEQLNSRLSYSPPEVVDVATSYAHPLLDHSVPPTDARHSTRPDLDWMQTALAPSVLTRSRQRAHSFPFALGLLARCLIKGTITPSRIRTRARSLDDSLSSDRFRF